MSPNSDAHEPGQTAGSGGKLETIDLKFETLRQFREVMAPRLNYEGFFVATGDPLPKGTPAKFRFLLPDGFVLAEGTAVVVWTREAGPKPDDPAGMALLFKELEHQNREIIDELIDFHLATGGEQFELGPAVGEPGEIGTDALMGESEKVQIPDAATEPRPAPGREAASESKKEFLPDWLSEVAQKHDVDLPGKVTVPTGDVFERSESSAPSEPLQRDFDISLMPEDEAPDETPFQVGTGHESEIMIPAKEKSQKPPRNLRLWPILAAAVFIVAASAIVWWLVNRAPGEALNETVAVVEPTPVPESTSEVLLEDAAEILDEAGTEDSGEEAGALGSEPAAPPIVEVSGPATRVLLVAAARVADATVVTVKVNGGLVEEKVQAAQLRDPARVWVRIQGIETFYRPSEIAVGTPEVERVRVGHHPEERPQSIYVVCDLASTSAVLRERTIEGDTLRIVVGLR